MTDTDLYNAREQLADVAKWLGWQDECLAFGLVNSYDALRLYDYAQAHPELPEMAEDWEPEHRVEALGYDPLDLPEALKGRHVTETGAAKARGIERFAGAVGLGGICCHRGRHATCHRSD